MSELGLGLDAGGTQTRWAMARADGEIVASGEAPGMSAHLARSSEGRERVRETMAAIAVAVLAAGRPARIQAGITGLADGNGALRALIAAPFGLSEDAVTLQNDIVFTYRGIFAPGAGYVVYSGTGSVASYIDADGTLHRAGGRGAILDDGGGGFWIAKEALRHIWRLEDASPGAWRESPMARAIFERLGGSEWAHSREAIYGGDRGELGKLALLVARAAESDPVAREILEAAGRELARLANAMTSRFGPRPIALTGRAALLHPSIADTMRADLTPGSHLEVRQGEAHLAAARLAANNQGVSSRSDPLIS